MGGGAAPRSGLSDHRRDTRIPDVACGQLTFTGGGPGVLVTADKLAEGNDGWAAIPSGDRVWLPPQCRSQLVTAGSAVRVVGWSVIGAMPRVPDVGCDRLLPSAASRDPIPVASGSAGPTIVVSEDKSGPGMDGWVRHTDGTVQWVSADCRSQLVARDVRLKVTPWSEISAMQPAPPRPCSSIETAAVLREIAPQVLDTALPVAVTPAELVALKANSAPGSITVARDPADGVTLAPSTGGTVAVGLPGSRQAADASTVQQGAVA